MNTPKAPTEFSTALEIVRKGIREDNELRRAYDANIAMAFYDEYAKTGFCNEEQRQAIHKIANKAADNFLNLWLKPEEPYGEQPPPGVYWMRPKQGNEGSTPVGIVFTMDYKGQPLNFSLPIQTKKIRKLIDNPKVRANLRPAKHGNLDEQAVRVGWRIVRDWVEAQMALVEVEMVTLEQVFLPYLVINNNGETLSERMLAGNGLKLLTQ